MQYELMYIVSATYTDEDAGKIETNVKALIEKYGGAVTDTKRLGKYRLAYPIKHVRHGHYILVNIDAESKVIGKVEEAIRLSPEVLRHLILRAEEAGGDKFDLVQFTEVNIDAKETSSERRRREAKADASKSAEEIKSGVATLEGKEEKSEGEAPAAAAKSELSDEEIDKKIDAALTGNA